MTARRVQCMEGPKCDPYARLTIESIIYQRERACPQHAVDVLNHQAGARVVWDDTRGINKHEATALRLAEERSQLYSTDPGLSGRQALVPLACQARGQERSPPLTSIPPDSAPART